MPFNAMLNFPLIDNIQYNVSYTTYYDLSNF